MSATPITPVTPVLPTEPDSPTRRIEHPTTLTLLRLAWTALLLFQLVSVAYLIPVNLSGAAILPEFVASRTTANIPLALSVSLSTLNAAITLAIAVVLMWRGYNRRVAVLFSFVFLALMTNGYILQIIEVVPVIIFSGRGILSSLAFLAIMYLFPDMRFVPAGMRYGFIAFASMIFVCYLPGISNPSVASGATYLGAVVGVGSFIFRYRRASLSQGQQIKWLLVPFIGVALLILVWAMAGSLLPRSIYPSVANFLGIIAQLLILSLPLAVGLAVLRYRLWDIDLVINRSLVYGAVTLLLALVFGGIIAVVSSVTQGQGSVIGLVLAAVAAGGLFNPARKAAQSFVDRRFYGLRFDLNELNAAQKSPEIKNPGALSGRKLGAYAVLDVIGKGGMGEVYKGQGNGQIVALKILPQDLAAQDEFRKRFEREVQTLQSLNHANIVKLYDSGVSDGITYLAMEYIGGVELGDKLKQEKVLSFDDANDILRGLISALDYAHEQGLVHRDIKPSNVMLRKSSDGETWDAVLMDFGIAKIKDAGTTITGTGAIGTIDYMAPEQIIAAKEVDKRADVYALGVMLYEMLTGERPFKGSPAQVMFAHIQQPPPDPRDVAPDMSRSVAKAITQAMEKKPEDRFLSAGEFGAALS